MVEIPLQLILFSLPVLVYVFFLHRRGQTWAGAFRRVGFQTCPPVYYAWAVGILVLTGGLAVFVTRTVPAEVLQNPNVSVSQYRGLEFSVGTVFLVLFREAFYTALGEEIFFRGFLGGLLFRRFGFAVGNAMQALLFLLPHLLLLLVSLTLWRLVVVQLLSGWLLGWLRYRSKSILPGWIAHSFLNTLGAFLG